MKITILVASLSLFITSSYAQSIKNIQLKPQPVTYNTSGFYISDVVDDRSDRSSIGKQSGGGTNTTLELQGGAAAAIKKLTVIQSSKSQPVAIHIAKLKLDFTKDGADWSGNADVLFAFYVAGQKVMEYSSRGELRTESDPSDYAETFLRQSLEKDLKRFDGWWSQNKGKVTTSDEVKTNVTIGRNAAKPNLIVYSLQRPVQISDFTGPADGSVEELAATFSGISFGYSGQTENGQVVLNVTITPYFDVSQSWFKEAGKNPRVLAHEQTHFNITAIKACEFAAAIRAAHLTRDNYEKSLKEIQQQNADASAAEQTLYDTETNHGTIADKQHEWEQKINEQVKACGCY